MPLHAQRQGFQAAQDHEAVERAGNRADGVLQITQPLANSPPRHTATPPPMTSEWPFKVLGRRMDDDIETVFQRSLRPGRGEGVVGHRQNAARAATAAIISRSTSFSSGLLGVSTQIIRVFGVSAASRAPGRAGRSR